jgi:hypothetical protein
VGITTTISPAISGAAARASFETAGEPTGDFVQDVAEMANRIDRRLRMSLSPEQYALVQDLVLATRITTIARDAADEHSELTAA